MASDDDIARLLPDPPPPHPARREANIAAALRRFDGAEPTSPGPAPRPSRWKGLGRPQLGVLVSAALIALIGAPAAWMSLHNSFPGAATPAATTNAAETVAVADTAAPPASPPSPAAAAALAQPSAAARAVTAPPPPPPRALADKAIAATLANDAPAAASPPPPPPAMKMAAPPPPPPPPAPAPAGIIAPAAPAREAQSDAAADIAVTGSRIRAPEASRTNRFSRGEDDDLDAVIARFDQAVVRDPHNSRAWLDRGLARQRNGDLTGALDDIDHAIRLAPAAPAGYRARARVERQRGDTARAAADERRAAELER